MDWCILDGSYNPITFPRYYLSNSTRTSFLVGRLSHHDTFIFVALIEEFITVLCVWIKLVTAKDRINKATAARSCNNSTPGTFQYHTFPCLSTWLQEHSWKRGWPWPQNKQQDSPNANRCGSLDCGGSLLRCWIRIQQDVSRFHDSTCAFLSLSMLLSGKMISAPSVFIFLSEGSPDYVQGCPFPLLVGSTSSLTSLNSVFQQAHCLALLIYN